MDNYGLIQRFYLVWITYWLVYLIQPVESVYPGIGKAWFLQLLFVMSVSIGYVVGSRFSIKEVIKSQSVKKKEMDQTEVEKIIQTGLWISLLGLCFLLYDKIYIQKIDYFRGWHRHVLSGS